MLTNTVMILAEDGTKMHGLHYKVEEASSRLVIHVHGMAGNFYENSFIERIAEITNLNKIDFLSFNNRGHDYIADCEKVIGSKTESFVAGCAYEKYVDCVFDLIGVMKWAISEGYSSVFLQGHSSGANKIIYAYESLMKVEEISNVLKGLILISPCDDIGIYHSETTSEERKKSHSLAQKYIDDLTGNTLMPLGTFFDYLLSAETFIECFKENSPLDMFPYRKHTLEDTKLKEVKIPKLIIFGNNGEFVLQNMDEIQSMYLDSHIESYHINVIDGANHSYRGKENQLAETVCNWIQELNI